MTSYKLYTYITCKFHVHDILYIHLKMTYVALVTSKILVIFSALQDGGKISQDGRVIFIVLQQPSMREWAFA